MEDGAEVESSGAKQMNQTEIKEFYVEELKLLKRIQSYGKEQRQGKLERVEKVTMLLLYRIYSNLYSSLLLTAAAYKKAKMSFFQLPIGIILRCCYTDCLFALYILSVDKNRAHEELELRTIEYANSLLERREVYRDQVKSTGAEWDDDLIDNFWELTMEDNFLGLLTFNDNLEDLTLTKQSKDQLKEAGFVNTKSVGTTDQKNFLTGIPELEPVATQLFHYYKYFSQYEHFSENGQGDVLASTEKNGTDNIHLPSAIKALSAGVQEMMKKRSNVECDYDDASYEEK